MKSYSDLKAELPYKRGDRVKIKKGAKIRTTYPKPNYDCKRSYVVTIHDVHPGYADSKPEVCWVGSGSYWFYTDIENVEKITPSPPDS